MSDAPAVSLVCCDVLGAAAVGGVIGGVEGVLGSALPSAIALTICTRNGDIPPLSSWPPQSST